MGAEKEVGGWGREEAGIEGRKEGMQGRERKGKAGKMSTHGQ